MDISKFITWVNDFPIKGSNAIDTSKLFSNSEIFNYTISQSLELAKEFNIDNIVAIETRGFIWGSALAFASKLPLHLARKPYRIPQPVFEKKFTSRSRPYSLNIEKNANIYGNVMIVDDILVSGATHLAVGELLTEHFNILPSNQFHISIIEPVTSWNGKNMLLNAGYNVSTLTNFK